MTDDPLSDLSIPIGFTLRQASRRMTDKPRATALWTAASCMPDGHATPAELYARLGPNWNNRHSFTKDQRATAERQALDARDAEREALARPMDHIIATYKTPAFSATMDDFTDGYLMAYDYIDSQSEAKGFARPTRAQAKKDCDQFRKTHQWPLIEFCKQVNHGMVFAGHCFWLSRTEDPLIFEALAPGATGKALSDAVKDWVMG